MSRGQAARNALEELEGGGVNGLGQQLARIHAWKQACGVRAAQVFRGERGELAGVDPQGATTLEVGHGLGLRERGILLAGGKRLSKQHQTRRPTLVEMKTQHAEHLDSEASFLFALALGRIDEAFPCI
jgi:hypothetical protein